MRTLEEKSRAVESVKKAQRPAERLVSTCKDVPQRVYRHRDPTIRLFSIRGLRLARAHESGHLNAS